MRIAGAHWRGFLRRFSRQHHPSCELNTVDDFFERHLDAIAEAMREPDVIHTCPYPPGRRIWRVSWRWPFVHTWISNSICLCEVNQILRGNRKTQHHIDDIVAILDTMQD